MKTMGNRKLTKIALLFALLLMLAGFFSAGIYLLVKTIKAEYHFSFYYLSVCSLCVMAGFFIMVYVYYSRKRIKESKQSFRLKHNQFRKLSC